MSRIIHTLHAASAEVWSVGMISTTAAVSLVLKAMKCSGERLHDVRLDQPHPGRANHTKDCGLSLKTGRKVSHERHL